MRLYFPFVKVNIGSRCPVIAACFMFPCMLSVTFSSNTSVTDTCIPNTHSSVRLSASANRVISSIPLQSVIRPAVSSPVVVARARRRVVVAVTAGRTRVVYSADRTATLCSTADGHKVSGGPGADRAEGRCFLSDGPPSPSLCARYASPTARSDGPRSAERESVAGGRIRGQRLMTAYDTSASICFPLRLTTWLLGHTMTAIY